LKLLVHRSLLVLSTILLFGIDRPGVTRMPGFVPADDWFERQRAYPFGDIPNELYARALRYVRTEMDHGDSFGDEEWVLAGPRNIEGRITSVAISPADPYTVFAGCANGGVWKSTDFCQTWTSVFDGMNTSSVGALAIDPVDPQTIYCGTGEANSLRSYYPGTGVYKSTDGGQAWIPLGLDSTFAIGRITINPLNPQELYVAALGALRRKTPDRGLYKSTDGGTTWDLVLFHSDSVGAVDVVIDPSNPARVFAAMWERFRREDDIKYGGPQTALYVSTDAGTTWGEVFGGFPSHDPTLGRISIDISASNPAVIYALTAFASGFSRGLYKSGDGGVSWTLVNSGVAASSNYAWFNRICRVDPFNGDRVFCGGLGMERSNNGGVSFASLAYSHVDQHALAFAPSNPQFIVLGNDGGVDYSTNGGSSWSYSNSLPVTQFYAGDIDFNNPDVILGGTQDNGTVRTLSGGLDDWVDIYGGDGFYCLVDPTNSQRVYASSQYGGLGRSTNGGNSFSPATTGLDLTYTNWMTPYVLDKNDPLTLYCGTYRIHRSTNGAQSWTPISPDLAKAHVELLGTITTVDVARSDPEVIYCGTDDANVWVTTDGGGAWTLINDGLPDRWVTRVAVDPDSANVCYVTLSGYKVDLQGAHIYRTADYGSSWQSIGGNLPDAPINDVVVDTSAGRTLYVATDVGVMYSTDLGNSWYVLGSGFVTSVPCHDLTLHQPTRSLVAWTHGRSAFRITLQTAVSVTEDGGRPADFALAQNYPNPFNPVTTIHYSIPSRALVRLKVIDVLGREVETLVDEAREAGRYSATWDAAGVSSGVYFYRLELEGQVVQTRKMILVH
jgi:photosystem II stability/assembly factor-like uncharacterized protein